MLPRRSCLSVPASSPKMLEKARGLPADEVVIDLEDAVAPDAKEEARAEAARALAGDWKGRSVAVRVNGAATEWFEADLAALAGGEGLGSVVVPKCEGAEELRRAADLLGGGVGLQALVETAAGLVAIAEVAAAPGLESLIVGYADLAASLGRPLGAAYPGDRWHFVRETVLVHARAAGLAAIDGPFLDFGDEPGLRESAAGARALGFDGKWAIHPAQLEVLNEVFSPTAEELERAKAILAALDGAARSGPQSAPGAVEVEGEMVDEASRKQAEDVVARARAAGIATG